MRARSWILDRASTRANRAKFTRTLAGTGNLEDEEEDYPKNRE